MDAQFGSFEAARPVGQGHLDRPLARTVRLTALRRRPDRALVKALRAADAAGPENRESRPSSSSSSRPWTPWRAAVTVGGWFGGLMGVVVLITLLVTREAEDLLPAAVILAFFTIVPGLVALVGVAVTQRSQDSDRWRRHARVATFAAQNGLRHQLETKRFELPDLVARASRGGSGVRNVDVVTGQVGARELRLGLRRSTLRLNGTSTPRRLSWIALAEGRTPTVLPDSLLEDCRRLLPRGNVTVEQDRRWVLIGVEDSGGSLTRVAGLLAAMDLVLDVTIAETVSDR